MMIRSSPPAPDYVEFHFSFLTVLLLVLVFQANFKCDVSGLRQVPGNRTSRTCPSSFSRYLLAPEE
jgi:hypothetical protein